MPYKINIFFVLLLIPVFALSNDFSVRSLGIEAGLSNNAVTCIYQDHRGFMWFGTYDGLNRFNGYNFEVFRNRVGDSTSLVTNSVYSIEEDAARRIWVGGQKGACVFDPVTARFMALYYQPAGGGALRQVKDNVHVIKFLGKDMLIGTNHSGLLLFEAGSKTGVQISLPSSENGDKYDVTAIEPMKDGSAWIFVQQLGLFRYDIKRKKLEYVTGEIRQANCFRLSASGKLWLGNEKGLFRYDEQSKKYSSNYIPADCKVVNVSEDRNGILWIASDGSGLLILDQQATKAKPFLDSDHRSPINSNAIYSIYEDKEGRKWIGTLRGGINIIEPNASRFRQIVYSRPGRTDPADNFILSFCEDRNENMWIGTDGAGLRYWERKSNTFYEYRKESSQPGTLSSNFITNILCDGNGQTWISTWFGGINRFNEKNKSFEHYTLFNTKTQDAENNVWLLFEDAQKKLWASATNDGSLYTFNPLANRFELFDASIQNLQCMAEDTNGDLWGGNYSELIRIDRSAAKRHRVYPVGYTIRSIHEDRHHNFWVGTQEGGLLLFDRKTGKYEQYTTNEGLPNNTVLRMLEDRNGNLWLSTYNGLSRFNIYTRSFQNFSRLDGLQNNQFSFNAALVLRNGEFAFGGINGFNLFHPDSLHNSIIASPVFLTGVSIDGKRSETMPGYITDRDEETIREIKVPFDRAVLSLDFLALTYSGADKISYAYLLEGWDKNWNYVNNIRTANYSRLQEGNYTFYVKVKQPDGKWSEQKQLLHIVVLPPWYRTWWAYSLYLALAALAIYLYISYTKRQERLRYEIKLAHLENEKDKELTEKKLSFFTNVSHEFRTPVSLIINPLKEIIQRKESEKDRQELNIVYRNARRLLSLVDQLLLFRKADSGADVLKISKLNVNDLCQEVFQCFIQQAKTRQIRYSFSAPPEPVELYADYEKLEIVLFNLLSNAFKFTPPEGSVECRVEDKAGQVDIHIRDTGCGIRKEDAGRVFEKFQRATVRAPKTGFGIGLYLAKAFVEKHQGTIRLNSEPGHGTEFIITLLKGNEHLPAEYINDASDQPHQLLGELIGDGMQGNIPPAIIPADLIAEELLTDKKTILIVDDNAEMREYLLHIFQKQYAVFAATNGLEGMEMASRHLPDLIISDINMDGIDGVELCRQLKRSEALGHIPVILLTASSSAEMQLEGIEGGADDYVRKPFDAQLLLVKVASILKNRNLLQRYFLDKITLQDSAVKVPAEYRDFLKQCIQLVEENLDAEHFTVQEFAKAMGMSRSALYNKVKHISGQSLNAFVRSIRLRRAAMLMIRERMNVNQAAFQVGIGDTRYFREQFIKLFGITPSEYIRKYRQNFNGDINLLKSEKDK